MNEYDGTPGTRGCTPGPRFVSIFYRYNTHGMVSTGPKSFRPPSFVAKPNRFLENGPGSAGLLSDSAGRDYAGRNQ